MTSLIVNEIYPCLQGEGFNLGKPSVLVRLQICNLRCSWCDTPYTHTFKSDPNKEDPTKQNFQRMALEAVVEKIKTFQIPHVIVSGGEPTLQNFSALPKLLEGFTFEVESNGTRIPHKDMPGFTEADYKNFQWNISPKGFVASEAIVEKSLAHWSQLAKRHEKVFFKFVIRKNHKEIDLKEILAMIQKFNIDSSRVYLMAEGTTVESQIESVWLHDICVENNFRYTPRLHVILFGPKRGI